MRISTSLTIPDELERARNAGQLVVFAGAGVSMGAPANLPSFLQLAREIADPPLPLRDEDKNVLDRYLGRAEKAGINVQERAREKLIERKGTPTKLHEHLLGIFGVHSNVRLITTNFDLHFNTATESVFGNAQIPRYVGPALPPGQQFLGIAQLHGSLSHTQDRLVLTKQDFAAAYMTEGWAARFLVRVFAERTVLFVGYALGDPVMQYLVSALPQTGRWYALCHAGEEARWVEHEVIPITFGSNSEADRFADLQTGLERWHWYAKASAVDHDRELRRLITLGPSTSPQEADYVRARLETEAGRITFWTVARDPQWFGWIADEKLLECLFDDRGNAPHTSLWARWCVTNFCSGDNPPILDFCRRRGVQIGPSFAFELALHLTRVTQLPPRAVLRQLVVLLVSSTFPRLARSEPYIWLLEKVVTAGFGQEAIALLGWMTQLRLEPLQRLFLGVEEETETPSQLGALATRVAINAAPRELDDFLEEHGADLASMADTRLIALGEQRLSEAYQLVALAKGTDDSSDWLSYGRTAIPSTNQDSHAHAEDVLIALIRTVLDHWRDHSPEHLLHFGDRHFRDERRLFKRLALHAYAECSSLSPDDLLAKAISEKWAADFWVRPEVYTVLKAHYHRGSEENKKRFVDSLRDDTSWGEVDEHQAHARFSLSQLLIRLSPQSAATLAFAEEEKRAHPDWQETDKDGLLSRIEVGWGRDFPSPIEVDQLLNWSPSEALGHVTAALERARETRRGGESLLGAVQQGIKKKPEWGAGFLEAVTKAETAPPVLEAIVWGLRDESGTAENQMAVLNALAEWHWPDKLTHSLGSLIDHWAGNLKGVIDVRLLNALDELADQVFLRGQVEATGILGQQGWTERAINHPSGHAASTWWRVANARDREGDKFVLTLDDNERARWERAVNDRTAGGAHARVIVGMASDRLVGGDYPWAERVLFPAFDPRNGEENAAQLWDGRLMHSNWSWTTIRGLRPCLGAFLEKSAVLVPARSRQLGGWIALLVAFPKESELMLADLQTFVQHASPEARREFAEALPEQLDKLDGVARREVWEKLLRPYWRDRRTAVPVALDVEEVSRMVSWIVSLPEVAADALAELIQTPGKPVPHGDRVIWEWEQDDKWISNQPTIAVAVIKWLAERGSLEPWTVDEATKLLEKALLAGAPKPDVIAAAEVLAGLPCQTAIDLVERLQRGDGGTDPKKG
jgi:hypothetical protein